jgi:hypothetical protein
MGTWALPGWMDWPNLTAFPHWELDFCLPGRTATLFNCGNEKANLMPSSTSCVQSSYIAHPCRIGSRMIGISYRN